ncbi:MAG: MEDS domain-containing protein [Nitrososphaerales archaeon]
MDVVHSLHMGEHVALFQEDSEYARAIEFGFLQDGLKKGEYCVYASIFDEPVEIETEMEVFGIDVRSYIERSLFHAYRFPASPASHAAGGLKGLEEFNRTVLSAREDIPYRLVGRLYPLDTLSRQHLVENLKIERHAQEDGFKERRGITVCSYPSKDLKSEQLFDWFASVLKAHDAAVFAPSPGNGAAFYMK